ncbi:MAG: EAL domain-containing protein [Synechococcales cyanobacterium C42_A2020_086]|nr:EAL domain-containing protein [Synechococcales cyanobacterium C42_A2020_086]
MRTQSRQQAPNLNFRRVTFTWRYQRQCLAIGLATLILMSLLQAGICQSLERTTYNWLFRWRGALSGSSAIVVIEIDEASLQQFGYGLELRRPYTALVTTLAAAEPALLVLDTLLTGSSPDDRQLATAMQQYRRVVLAQAWDAQGNPLLTSSQLIQAAAAIGHTEWKADPDGIVRHIALQQQGVLALGAIAAQAYGALQSLERSLPTQQTSRLLGAASSQWLWLNWLGPPQTIPHYSLSAVLQGQVPLATFRQKIVFAGSTFSQATAVATPFQVYPPSSQVYLHATVANNLIQQNGLTQLPLDGIILLFPILKVIVVSATSRWRLGHQIAVWSGLCCGWAGLGWLGFQFQLWLPIATPILWLGLTGLTLCGLELRQRWQRLYHSEERYALALQSCNEGLWDWDLQHNRCYFSPRWKEMLGYQSMELSDRPQEWFERVHPQDRAALHHAITEHLQGRTPDLEQEYRVLHQDGSYRWMQTRGRAVAGQTGKPKRLMGTQLDITRRKQMEDELWHHAFCDPLTELPNRSGFIQSLQQAIHRVQQDSMSAFAILWLDLDQFKLVNNSLGSAAGDRLLVAVAQRLRSFLPADDVVARLGGDEFAILLQQVYDVNDAVRTAERVQQVLALPFNLEGQEVFVTISVGIALSAAQYLQPESLLRDANTAMHWAKALGRARCQVFDKTMRTRLLVKLRLENDLRRAIAQGERYTNAPLVVERNWSPPSSPAAIKPPVSVPPEEYPELELYYQPIVRLASRQVIGFEALVRWQHAQQGLLFPSRFISMAEETGLIIPLSWWVLRTACRQMRQWRLRFPEKTFLTMSVNLSSKQFSMPGLTEQIRQILAETHLEANHLKLELTESLVLENAMSVVDVLYQIRSLGIQLAIDDFGTGYSSLSYLPRFPVNTLKIDRSFVSQIGECHNSLEIVRTILALAKNLHLDVVAEGVETEAQARMLQEMHCELGQGYFFSKPVDANTATRLLDSL